MAVFVGLIQSGDWRPPEDLQPPPPPRRRPPWRLLVWALVWCWALALVPVADHVLGHVAGYVAVLVVVGLVAWPLDRWGAKTYLRGLRDHQA